MNEKSLILLGIIIGSQLGIMVGFLIAGMTGWGKELALKFVKRLFGRSPND
jgi:hypothetical protein